MALSASQIQEIVQRPKHRGTVQRALTIQRRIRFHTEPNTAICDMAQTATEFLEWVKGLLPKDKYAIFLQLFQLPISTTSITEDAYRELARLFQSRNASSFYQFSSSEMLEDWLAYKKNKLNEPNVWKNEGWRNMQVCPNSILVVDLPVEQATLYPEPYFYWLGIEHVIDYSTPDGSVFDWLLFWCGDHRIAVFDEAAIRVYTVNDKLELTGLVSEAKHSLGYCPARFFWTDYINADTKELKRNPVVKELANLNWYLFFSLSKRHLDTYAPYPIYSAYEADCDFENNETGDYCDGGYLRDSSGHYKLLANGALEPCPCCSQKRIAGPGSFLEVPIPNQAEGIMDMRNPVQITSIDRESLDYNVEECKRLRDELIDSMVGQGETVNAKEAVNTAQITANFESKISVLTRLKTNFENAEKFVNDTICKLRYGEAFINSTINWGTEFYVFSVVDLYEKYKSAKENGASMAELDAIAKQIHEVEYQTNPAELQRILILGQLEPYQTYTFDELINLHDSGVLDDVKYIIKCNFISFINRFELENTNIVQFGSNISLAQKIKIINNKLEDYAKEELRNIESRNSRRSASVSSRVVGFETGV